MCNKLHETTLGMLHVYYTVNHNNDVVVFSVITF